MFSFCMLRDVNPFLNRDAKAFQSGTGFRLRDCGAGSFRRPVAVAIAFQIPVETGAADAEDVRGAQSIALAHVQHPLDVDLADFFER